VDDEGKRPPTALGLLRSSAAAALGYLLAEGWRPGQRQHVEIKLAWGVLPAVLRRRRDGKPDQACKEEVAQASATPRHPTQTKAEHDDALTPKPMLKP
jgi:hypothetical protein